MKAGVCFGLCIALAGTTAAQLPPAQQAAAIDRIIKPNITYRCETVRGTLVSSVVVVVKIGSYISAEEILCGEKT